MKELIADIIATMEKWNLRDSEPEAAQEIYEACKKAVGATCGADFASKMLE